MSADIAPANWVELEGSVNVRDVGGMPTIDGGRVRRGVLLRSANGVVVALILSAVGVLDEWIAADYAATEAQLEAIAAHLRRSASDIYTRELAKSERIPPPSSELMLAVLEAVEREFGGVADWLAGQGWTALDTRRLRERLIEPAREGQ